MGWLSGYQYRKKVTISGSSGAGQNYQVKLTIGSSSGGVPLLSSLMILRITPSVV